MNIPCARESVNQDVHQGVSPPAMCSLYNGATSSSGASIQQVTNLLCTGVLVFQLWRTGTGPVAPLLPSGVNKCPVGRPSLMRVVAVAAPADRFHVRGRIEGSARDIVADLGPVHVNGSYNHTG